MKDAEIISFALDRTRNQNPYPLDIFTGETMDGKVGRHMHDVWNNCLDKVIENLKEINEDYEICPITGKEGYVPEEECHCFCCGTHHGLKNTFSALKRNLPLEICDDLFQAIGYVLVMKGHPILKEKMARIDKILTDDLENTNSALNIHPKGKDSQSGELIKSKPLSNEAEREAKVVSEDSSQTIYDDEFDAPGSEEYGGRR